MKASAAGSRPVVIVTSDRFVDHVTPPGHPERPARAETMELVADRWQALGGEVAAPRPASRDELARVHDPRYLDLVAGTAGRAVALDPDTVTSPDSHDVACLAAGAAVTAVERMLTTAGPGAAYVFARPPGHHAEPDRAMGFCLYNNVAVAAAHARAHGAGRVAVVDYDVHHGNGTQAIFYADPDVLYLSTHQYPYYPGTGAVGETGAGRGTGFTVNVPLEAGATDADYELVFATVVIPVLQRFRPDLLLVSAGFDAHVRDPLAGMRMTTGGYGRLTASLCQVADACCGGRIVLVTEGGYDLQALAQCLQATLTVVAGAEVGTGEDAGEAPAAPGRDATRRAERALEAVRAAQRPFWGEL